jgi:hypothetical protein
MSRKKKKKPQAKNEKKNTQQKARMLYRNLIAEMLGLRTHSCVLFFVTLSPGNFWGGAGVSVVGSLGHFGVGRRLRIDNPAVLLDRSNSIQGCRF